MHEFVIRERSRKGEDFFSFGLTEDKSISVIVVCHMIDTAVPFIKTLDKFYNLAGIVAKPKSIDPSIKEIFKDKVLEVNRSDLKNNPNLITNLVDGNSKLILLDIGGYFTNQLDSIYEKLENKFLGVIEDTENGYQKYYKLDNLPIPVFSVARSPLKKNEDHLVGQAVVFSMNLVLRELGSLLNNMRVGVIGYGKIGNGIISSLNYKGCDIHIYDKSPVKILLALSFGNKVSDKYDIIKNSDVIFCSTGNQSIQGDEFKYLKCGAFIASVTSSDDELDLEWVNENYYYEEITKDVKRYFKNGHYFYLVNDGNAINFLHGAVVGNYILLVQKEMIDLIGLLKSSSNFFPAKILESPNYLKEKIANIWINQFKKLNI